MIVLAFLMTAAVHAASNESAVALEAFSKLGAPILALLALFVSLMSFVQARYDRRDDIDSSKSDEYWFRTIIVPNLLKRLEELVDSLREMSLGNEAFDGKRVSEEFNSLRSAFSILLAVDSDLLSRLDVYIDRLEDITTAPALGDPDEVPIDFVRSELVRELMRFHLGRRFGPDAGA